MRTTETTDWAGEAERARGEVLLERMERRAAQAREDAAKARWERLNRELRGVIARRAAELSAELLAIGGGADATRNSATALDLRHLARLIEGAR